MKAYRQNVTENLVLAFDTLRSHKIRSFLTILGVLIGTTTVIAVASVFAGLDRQVSEAAEDFGTRNLFIYKFDPGIHVGRLSREERLRKPLTFEDSLAIKEQCPSVDMVAVETFIWWAPSPVLRYKGMQILDYNFQGNTAEDFRALSDHLADGRFFTDIDDLHRRNVAVIGSDVAKRFFPHADPVGKSIVIGNDSFEVLGALEPRKAFPGDNGTDRVVKIPYLTFRKLYPSQKEHFIIATAAAGKLNLAQDEVESLLRRRRHLKPSDRDNFGIATAETVIGQFRQLIGTVVLVTVVISSIGLLVGGIGVMNIMLVSVTERTREIGVRKAVGARRSDITWQFLLEAMTLTGSGGLLGLLLGFGLSFLIRTLGILPSAVPLWSVVTGLAVAVSVGLFFGLWPALKASRLDPIAALRYE